MLGRQQECNIASPAETLADRYAWVRRVASPAVLVWAFPAACLAGYQLSLLAPVYRLPSIVLLIILASLAVVDFVRLRLPNVLTATLALTGMGMTAVTVPEVFSERLMTSVTTGLGLYAFGELYRLARGRSGLGLGDVKLVAAAGLWLPLPDLALAIVIGSATAMLYFASLKLARPNRLHQKFLPLGTFLCLGIWFAWVYGPFALGGV